MKKSASLNRRLTLWSGFFTLIMLGLMEGMSFFLLPDQPPSWLAAKVGPDLFKAVIMIVVAGLFFFWLLSLWLVIWRMTRKETVAVTASAESRKSSVAEGAAAEKERRRHHDKKLFLHLLAVLQAEGRLLDFLNEDLDRFEDGQIGAAARGVHEGCKAALSKYVTLQSLSSQSEGDRITVASGFDPGVYRLSGNVTGDPPFEGQLVHKGWRAGRLNIPDFSFSGDPEIIAPMEVDVK